MKNYMFLFLWKFSHSIYITFVYSTLFLINMKAYLLNIVKRYKIQLGLLLFFLVWMLFFDEYNWLRIRNDSQKLENLKEERLYLKEKIEKDRQQLHTLQNDTEALERFAREEYMLKKEDEEVFIIIDDEDD